MAKHVEIELTLRGHQRMSRQLAYACRTIGLSFWGKGDAPRKMAKVAARTYVNLFPHELKRADVYAIEKRKLHAEVLR